MTTQRLGIVVAGLLFAVAFAASSAELGTQRSSERGVTVAVTPQNIGRDASTWEFKVILDTHSADLSDDLLKSAVLVDSAGKRHSPLAWDGAPQGGHHREGILRFAAVAAPTTSVELVITRPGEPVPRSFKWKLQ
jgi:hypothetical protein